MTKNEIQEQRMRGYFIDATRSILKSEGLKVVSARNVAEIAGYSYATLYNYFKDIKELIFECVLGFQDECTAFVDSQTAAMEPGIPKIRSIAISYMKYFVEYPGIFELFFIESPGDLGNKQPTVDHINTFLNRLCEKDWQYALSKGLISEAKVEQLKYQLKYVTTGMLMFYLHRREPVEYSDFIKRAEDQISAIFMITE